MKTCLFSYLVKTARQCTESQRWNDNDREQLKYNTVKMKELPYKATYNNFNRCSVPVVELINTSSWSTV